MDKMGTYASLATQRILRSLRWLRIRGDIVNYVHGIWASNIKAPKATHQARRFCRRLLDGSCTRRVLITHFAIAAQINGERESWAAGKRYQLLGTKIPSVTNGLY